MDVMNFDGSCCPNPSGRMGFGWVVSMDNNSFSIYGSGESKTNYSNNALIAEYIALKRGLIEYVKASGEGPLMIYGDSQSVIYQMSGYLPVADGIPGKLYNDILCIIKEYELDVSFQWVPRYQNREADELSKIKSRVHAILPNDRVYITNVDEAPISPGLRQRIIAMNQNPHPNLKSFKQLHLPQRDIFSDMELSDLRELAGEHASEIAMQEFPGKKKKSFHNQAQVLRWMLRGLSIDLSICKVRADTEVKKKSIKKQKSPGNRRSKFYINRHTVF